MNKIPFLKNQTQERVSQTPDMGQEPADLIQVEIKSMVKKESYSKQSVSLGSF